MADVALTLPGANKTGIPSLIDIVTNQPITDAVFSNPSVNNGDPTIANVTADANGILTVTPLAPGTTTVITTLLADYTDSTGNKIVGALVPGEPDTLTVTAVVTPDGVKLVYTWS